MIKATKKELKESFLIVSFPGYFDVDKVLPEESDIICISNANGNINRYRKFPGSNILLESGLGNVIGVIAPKDMTNKIVSYRKKTKNKEKIFKFVKAQLYQLLTNQN